MDFTGTTTTKSGSYTTTQSGVALWTPGTGKTILVDAVQIQAGGTTAGNIRLWFGASGDTTYTAGTDQQLVYFDAGTPSATSAPGLIIAFPTPIACANMNYILRVTTSANVTVEVIVHGDEI